MNRLDEIAHQRRRLLALTRAQRDVIGDAFGQIQKPLGIVNMVTVAINYIKARPLLTIGISTVFLVARPRRFISWGRKIWVGWQLYRSWKSSKKLF